MFCEKCGSKIEDDSLFCSVCGERVNRTEKKADSADDGIKSDNSAEPAAVQIAPAKNRKKIAVIAVAAAAVIAIAVALIFIINNISKTIDLNKYVEVEFSGYDGYGKASAHLDTDRIYKDYEKKFDNLLYGGLEFVIYGKLDNQNHLSNGDTVTYVWSANESDIKSYEQLLDIRLVYSDIELMVSGLEDTSNLVQLDPFDKLNIDISGVSGHGTMKLTNNNTVQGLYFTSDNNSKLSNGDVVTINVSYNEDAMVTNGYRVTATEKKITVDALDEYVTSLSQLPKELKNDILSELDRFVTEMYLDDDTKSLTDYAVLGYYMLTPKGEESISYWDPVYNQLYIVYKANIHTVGSDFEENCTAYKYIKYTDIIQHADGTVYVDISEYTNPVKGGMFYYGDDEYYFQSANKVYYAGFTSLDLLEEGCIYSQQDDWDIERDIDQEADKIVFEEVYDKTEMTLVEMSYTSKTDFVTIDPKASDTDLTVDLYGNTYTSGLIYPTPGTHDNDWADPTGANNNNEGYVIWNLNGNYKRFAGTIYTPSCVTRNYDESKSESEDTWYIAPTFVVYGDGVVLYELPFVSKRDQLLLDFDINIEGVKELKIEITGVWTESQDTATNTYVKKPKLCLGNAVLYR